MEDINVHLTNNAVQKHSQSYGKFEEGNQLSFRHLKSLISKRGKNPDHTMGTFLFIQIKLKKSSKRQL